MGGLGKLFNLAGSQLFRQAYATREWVPYRLWSEEGCACGGVVDHGVWVERPGVRALGSRLAQLRGHRAEMELRCGRVCLVRLVGRDDGCVLAGERTLDAGEVRLGRQQLYLERRQGRVARRFGRTRRFLCYCLRGYTVYVPAAGFSYTVTACRFRSAATLLLQSPAVCSLQWFLVCCPAYSRLVVWSVGLMAWTGSLLGLACKV